MRLICASVIGTIAGRTVTPVIAQVPIRLKPTVIVLSRVSSATSPSKIVNVAASVRLAIRVDSTHRVYDQLCRAPVV